MRRDSTDHDLDDVELIYPEMCGERLARAIRHGAFPAPDYTVGESSYWHEATIIAYTEGRAAVEGAAGADPILRKFIDDSRGGGNGA